MFNNEQPFFYLKNMKTSILFFILLITAFTSAQSNLDNLIDKWHQSASEADYKAYFGLMDSSFIFLGTAPNERWSKVEFSEFSKPYFDSGKAWSFVPSNRIWNFSSNGKTAWFDEDLETWMEDCRATGVMILTSEGWKIAYYNLHVLIENEKIKEFILLRKVEIKKEG